MKKEEAQNQGLDLETAAAHQCRSSMGPENRAQCGRGWRPPPSSASPPTCWGETSSDKATEGKGGRVRSSCMVAVGTVAAAAKGSTSAGYRENMGPKIMIILIASRGGGSEIL